jgi:hypothetical protein
VLSVVRRGGQADSRAQYLLEDLEKYYFHFHDIDREETELITPMSEGKYKYTVSIPRLIEQTKDTKLIEIGSMFGSGRLAIEQPDFARRKGFFQRSLAFDNPVLSTPANQIQQLMGGSDAYIGLHCRVGDGWFLSAAPDNMREIFSMLLGRLSVPQAARPALFVKAEERMQSLQAPEKRSIRPHLFGRRHLSPRVASEPAVSSWALAEEEADEAEQLPLQKRQVDSMAVYSTKLGAIRTRAEMKLASTLHCRGELHTDPRLLALNNPVYIATDSRSPLTEPALSYFWANFPCAFILSDFDRPNPQNTGELVHSLKVMEGAVNENDGVKLGRLLLPFMEAMVASKAALTIGTTGSTFSGLCVSFAPCRRGSRVPPARQARSTMHVRPSLGFRGRC